MNDVAASTKAQRRSAQCNSALPVMRRIMALACWLFLGGSLRRLALAAFALLLLGDARAFAAQAAQVIELGAAYLAAAHDLDRIDHRRIEREHALDALTIGNLAHREVLVEPGAGAPDAHALIGLDAAALALHHLVVDDERVARLEIGNGFAGGKLRHLLLFELFDQVHRVSPSAAPEMQKAHVGVGGLELACFYDTARALSPVRGGLLGRAGAGQMGGPEVGPALAGEPFGLRPPPSRNFGVIAASEHVGDSAAFEHLGPGILR